MLSITYYKMRIIGVLIVVNLLQINSFGQNHSDNFDEPVKQTVEDYLFLSKSYFTRSNIKALEFSQKALEIALEIQGDSLLAKAYKGMGVASYYAGQNENAITYYDTALIYFEKTNNQIEIANVNNNLGICYNILDNKLKAIDCYIEAIRINSNLMDFTSVGHISNNLGTIYYELFAFDEAMKYYNEAKRIAKTQNDNLGIHTATNNIGLIQQYTKEHELAKSSFFECLHLAKELKDESLYAIGCFNIGSIYISQNNADSAYFYFKKALDFYERVERPTAKIWLGIGRSYKINNQENEAIRSFQKALNELKSEEDISLKIDILHEMYLLYERIGNVQLAYEILKQYHVVFDSVKAKFDSTALTNQRSNFELDRKKREIKGLQQENNFQTKKLITFEANQKQRNILFYVCVVGLVIFILIILIYLNAFKKLKALKGQLFDENKLLQKEQKELKASYHSLKQDEEMLRWLINTSPDIISVKDGNGRWLEANESFTNLLGLKPNEYKNLSDEEIAVLYPAIADVIKRNIVSDELCWQKRNLSRGDEEYINSQGVVFVFDVIRSSHNNEDGSRKRLITIGRDISHLKNLQIS